MNLFYHKSLAEGKWFTLSLCEQLGHIGSEINRVIRAKENKERLENAILRALELFDLTLSDTRWQGRFKEIARTREFFCDAISGGHEYGISLDALNKYFYHFAIDDTP